MPWERPIDLFDSDPGFGRPGPAMTDDDRCQVCGSDDLEPVEAEYYTGVVAPDGVRERWVWIGVRCRACGEKEEH
jgi:hypothetical protein